MNLSSILGNESRFGRAMTKCACIIAINLLFVITCIPFVTAGAAYAAMYHAIFKMIHTDADRFTQPSFHPFKAYWEGLKQNFLTATLYWLGFVAIVTAGYMDLQICRQAGGALGFLSVGVTAVMVTAFVMIAFLLPLLTQVQARFTQRIKMAAYMIVSKPMVTVLILVLSAVMPVLLYLDEVNRPSYAFAGTFFAFALSAWVNGKLLLPQIKRLHENFAFQTTAENAL